MGEYTLDDLVDDAGGAASAASGGSSEGSVFEGLNRAIETLDEKGLLRPMLFGPERSMDEIQSESVQSKQADAQAIPAPEDTDSTGETSDGAGGAAGGLDGLDSGKLKGVMLQVYDHADDIPGMSEDPNLSELIKFVDNNPELVDQLVGSGEML